MSISWFTRNFLWFAAVVLTALVEATWLGVLRLQGVLPDLVLLLVVYFALRNGAERAMFTGVVGGAFQDVAGNAGLGHHILCLVVLGFIVGNVSRRLITEQPAVKAVLVFAASLVHGILYTLIAYVQNPELGALQTIAVSVVPRAFYTALVTPLVFLVLQRSIPGGPAMREA